MSVDFIIVDTETLSNDCLSAPILSCGAIASTWDKVDTNIEVVKELSSIAFHKVFNVKYQVDVMGLKPNKETVEFWKKQSGSGKDLLFSKDTVRTDIRKFPELFIEYCKNNGVDKNTLVLVRTPHFDIPILSNIFQKLGHENLPFAHWKIRDVRSIIDTATGSDKGYVEGFRDTYEDKLGLVAHNALHDCIRDLLQVKIAMESM